MPHAHSIALSPLAAVLALRSTAKASEYELLIYGQIGASFWEETVTAADVIAQLDTLPAAAAVVHVRINSIGGSVPDGLAIYNALKRCPAQIIVTVDGVAASIASLIAMAGDEVRMPATSMMMVHDPRVSWMELANADALREAADMLDAWAVSMAAAYAAKTGISTDEVIAQLLDGKDHYYTGEQAVAAHLADTLETFEPVEADPALTATLERLVAQAPEQIRHLVVASAARQPVHAPSAPHVAAPAAAPAATTTGAHTMPNPNNAAPQAEPAANAATITAQAHTALRERNESILATLEPCMAREGIRELYVQALGDPDMTLAQVQAKALTLVGAQAEPLARGMHVELGADSRDKMRAAGEQILLARAGVITGADAERARQGNPFARATLVGMAESLLIQAGVDTRGMSREDIARRALAVGQSTGDFPVLLENVLHKTLVGAYNTAAFTWNRFCSTGTLSDYRPHNRYHLSSFSDLQEVGEGGEYKAGTLGDGEKETITGKRKGRILNITPEVLINDDLGAFIRLTQTLGQAAGRTIEKDVYALLALNGGLGPVMSDGLTLFHADHGNIAATPAVPTVTSVDAMRVALGKQMDPGGNDFLDLMLAIWLGPLGMDGDVRVLNEAQYDVSVANKFQVPNKSRGLFRDVVGTPRLTGNAWYGFADPAIEPVIEVAFLDGVQTPTLQQETKFATDGLAWKVVHRYGVGGVGWRGAQRNAGA
jgi:ATP-dependent protease ClpP protease subunit